MISLAALFLFGWFFFKSVGLAFRVAWCAARWSQLCCSWCSAADGGGPAHWEHHQAGAAAAAHRRRVLFAEKLRITAQKTPLCGRKWHTRRSFLLILY